MTRSCLKWTLYDTKLETGYGGEWDSEDQARRWRDNAELPTFIVPMESLEVKIKAAQQVNDLLPP
jgi:hypothetical protein